MLRTIASGTRSTLRNGIRNGVEYQRVVPATLKVLGASQRQRWYANDRKTTDETILPGTQSVEASGVPPAPKLVTPSTPTSSTIITPEQAPKVPPPPPPSVNATAAAAAAAAAQPPRSGPTTTGAVNSSAAAPRPSSPPSSIPPPPPPKKKRRIRRFFILTTTLLGLSYAGGVYYSLHNDDFHDFFVDYIPGGEEMVLFFEEREFKRRFPNGVGASSKLYPQVSGEHKVTISGRSGAAARPSSSSKDDNRGTKLEASKAKPVAEKDPSVAAVEEAKNHTKGTSTSSSIKETAKEKARSAKEKVEQKVEEVTSRQTKTTTKEEPSRTTATATPIAAVDVLNIDNAADPVVQKLTKMLNDVITAVNADNASGKFSSTLNKAKDELTTLATELGVYRDSQVKAAEEQIKKNDADFEKAAKDMLSRVEQERKDQELRWREEYEAERNHITQTYEDRLRAEIEALQKVADQRLHNELLQQNIKLQDSFADTIRNQVETERDARLSKLSQLSNAVAELEHLTSKWNEVVDANLKTQHLVVAVDAVRTALESADRPTPFLHELVALKETADGNGIVSAAIASINPVAYQRGIPTAAQLIDRFRRVASEVRKAALLPEDAGAASHAASFVLSKVLFKKQGFSAGAEDVESILTRTETLLEEGDLDEAAREMNGLTGWARVLSQDWLGDCRRVLEVKQAVEVMATEAKLQSLMVE